MKIFLDTNVLIDFILERAPFYHAAAMIISCAVDRKLDISVSSMSVVTAKFVCVDRCKMPIALFRTKLAFLREFMDVCSVDATDVYHSFDARWTDFEDGVQYYAATRWGADYVVTRNVKDFQEENIPILSLDDMCQHLRNIL